jgi:DUF4097 and DUF4098 domain-containing protein YvlB
MLKFSLFLIFTTITFQSLKAQNDMELYQEKSFNTGYGKTFTLGAVSGDSKITTWDREEVSIKIYANREARDKVIFEFNSDDNGVTVKEESKNKNERNSYNNVKIRYEISMPKRYNTSIATASGDLELGSLEGNVNYTSASGDIKSSDITGKVIISTASGDINLSSVTGETEISTASGEITCSSLSGDISASTASGDIVLTGNRGALEVSTASGDITINYSGTNMGATLNSVSGDIHFNYSGEFSADLKANTLSGDIELAGNITAHDPAERKRKSIDAKINGGGERLNCSTVSGDIDIKER